MLYSIVGILVIILDQLVKYWVDKNINWTNPTIPLIPKVLSLVRVQNDGAAFSFLSGGSARIWFIVLTAVFALLVVLALATNFVSGRFGRWCLVLITAGGLSNMIDRIRFGYVIDMFKFELFDFAVFNVADIFIAVFCIAFIIYILFGGEKEREPDADEFDEDDYEEEIRPRRSRSSRSKSVDLEENEEEEEPKSRRLKKKAKNADADEDHEDEPQSVRKARPQRSASPAATVTAAAPNRKAPREDAPARPQPARRTAAASASSEERPAAPARPRTASQSQSDAMFEEMFAHKDPVQKKPAASRPANAQGAQVRRNTSPSQNDAAVAAPKGKAQSSDPFAEWEEANARVQAGSKAAYRKATEGAGKIKISSDRTPDAFSEFLAASSSEKSAPAKPAPKSAPARRPEAKPAAAPAAKPAKPAARKPAEAPAAKPAPKPVAEPTSVAEEFDLDSILNEFK